VTARSARARDAIFPIVSFAGPLYRPREIRAFFQEKEASPMATTRSRSSTKSKSGGSSSSKGRTSGGSSGRGSGKRELINTGTDKRYVRRSGGGQFKESDDVGRSLAADRRTKAKTVSKSGQGDKGDRKRSSSKGRA
jgi:hypothetical protein